MSVITIVDYGMGNLRSVAKAVEKVGATVKVTSDPAAVRAAEVVILPGVGAFRAAYDELVARRLLDPVVEHLQQRKPFLGICLGLQLLFESSEEEGFSTGLGVFKGKVVRFRLNDPALKVPHMGWNQVLQTRPNRLLAGLPEQVYFYFVHSYYVAPEDPELTIGQCEYGSPFTAAIGQDPVFAVQFHPEKSQTAGQRLLKNFVELAGS